MAAHSLSQWLATSGHTVHVLTSAHQRELAGIECIRENLTVERHYFAGLYQIYQAQNHNAVVKGLWHLHDHHHLTAEAITSSVIQRVRPDLINTHSLQGIGYNLLNAVAKSEIPCVQTLHDFGFLCINVNRFKDGKECEKHHLPCQYSAQIKRRYLEKISRLSFWSPSEALLKAYQPYLPPHAHTEAIPLPLYFSQPEAAPRIRSNSVHFLYVGQITPWKGVRFLLDVFSSLKKTTPFIVEIIGGGSDLASLRETYAKEPWVIFHGKLPPEKIGQHMASADLLLTPSLWFENAPLVISQAIQSVLPVFASRIGGLDELVKDGMTGRLLPAGDKMAWTEALREVILHPEILDKWRLATGESKSRFSVDQLGQRVIELFEKTIGVPVQSPANV